MRVAYLTLEAPRVGQASHVHVYEIVGALRRNGWLVRVFQPSYTTARKSPGTMRRLLEYAMVQVRLWLTHSQDEAIYIRAHFMAFPTALLCRWFKVPVVQEVNGQYQDIFITYPWLSPFRQLLEGLQRVQYVWADKLIAVTPGLSEWLCNEAKHHRVAVVPNGANVGIFHPEVVRPTNVPDVPYAIFFGGLARWHGIGSMLEAVRDPAWPAGVRLLIIGYGGESHRVQNAAAVDCRVIYQGYCKYEELPGWVAGAICSLIPITSPGGRSETGVFPLKLFESLACGVPVIVTDYPGQADLVREHNCGIVIPPDDPKALAMAVFHLYNNPKEAQNMGLKGAAIVSSQYSWDRSALEISNHIIGVMNNKKNHK